MIDPTGTGTATALVVGVTGHRELRNEDRDSLQAQVRSFFLDLRTRYPELPLVLLSPLAEGADSLVADVIRAWPAPDRTAAAAGGDVPR